MITNTSELHPTNTGAETPGSLPQPPREDGAALSDSSLANSSVGSVAHSGMYTDEFPLASTAFENVLRDWVGSICRLFERYPAVLVFVPSGSALDLGAFCRGAIPDNEMTQKIGEALKNVLQSLLAQEPESNVESASSAPASRSRVFPSTEKFREVAKLPDCGVLGGQVLLQLNQVGENDAATVVMLPVGQTFTDAELKTIERIGSLRAQALDHACTRYWSPSTPAVDLKADPEPSVSSGDSAPKPLPSPRKRRTTAQEVEIAFKDKDLLTTSQAGRIIGVSRQTVARMFDSGVIGGFKVPGSRYRRISGHDLRQHLNDARQRRSESQGQSG